MDNYKRSRKYISIIIAVLMTITMLPMTVSADPGDDIEITPITYVEVNDVPTPVAGRACTSDKVFVLAEPDNMVSIIDRYWYDETANKKADKFIEGHEYTFNISLECGNIYYSFPADLSVAGENKPYQGVVDINGVDAAKAEVYHDALYVTSAKVKARRLDPVKSVSVELYRYNQVKVTWPKVAGVDGYEIERKDGPNFEYENVTQDTNYTFYGMAAGTKYIIRISPFINGENFAECAYASPKNSVAIYTLKKLRQPKVSRKSSGKVTVRWNNIPGESGYQISKSTKKNKTGTIYTVKTTTGKSKVISAKKGKTYYYKVRAYRTVRGKKVCAPWSTVKAYKLR